MRTSTTSTREHRRWRHRRALIVLAGLAVAALAIAVPVAWATFSDVPPASPFYNDVNAIQGAGITQGCGGGNFCPGDPIQRQAEAAFVHRAAGRVASNENGNFSLDGGGVVDLAVITISVGGVAGQTQFVNLDGAVGAFTTTPADDVAYFISQDGVGQVTFLSGFSLPTAGPSGVAIGSGAVNKVVAVPSGTTQTFRLSAVDFANTGGIEAWGQLSAVTAPFGSTGANTLGVSSSSGRKGGLSRK